MYGCEHEVHSFMRTPDGGDICGAPIACTDCGCCEEHHTQCGCDAPITEEDAA